MDLLHYSSPYFRVTGWGLAIWLWCMGTSSAHPGHHAPSQPSTSPPKRASKRVAQRGWGGSKKLVDIRYKAGRKHTRIVVLIGGGRLSGVAEGEAPAKPRIGLPFRVYVDLTPCIPLRYWTRSAFRLGNKRIRKIRVGRNTLRTTRVVLELRRQYDYRVTMLRNPMRIVIDVGKTLPATPSAKMRMPSLSPDPLGRFRRRRRTRRRQHSHQHKHSWTGRRRGPGSWKPKAGRPWVLRGEAPKQLPFAFRVRSIAIDAGHGGKEDGAVGRTTRLPEKVVTLAIAKRLRALLRRKLRGIRVFLVRRRDRTMTLDQRVARIKRGGADLMISIHANSNLNRKVSGISTYVLHWSQRFNVARMLSSNALIARENQGVHPKQFNSGVSAILDSMALKTNLILSKYLGLVVQSFLMKRVKRSHAIRDLGVRRGLFYLLYATGVPSILVEASFLSNRREERLLRTRAYRNKIALGIADGVVRFVKMARQSLRRRRKFQRLPRKRRRSR